jgi:hypothetical protein
MVVHNCPNKRLPFRGVPFMFTIAETNDSAMQLHLPLPPAMDSDFTGMSILGISQGADGWRLKGPKTRWFFSCFFSEKSWGSWWKMMGISFNITSSWFNDDKYVGYSVDNELVDVCPWMNGRSSSKPWARRLQHDMLDCIFPHTQPIWGFLSHGKSPVTITLVLYQVMVIHDLDDLGYQHISTIPMILKCWPPLQFLRTQACQGCRQFAVRRASCCPADVAKPG